MRPVRVWREAKRVERALLVGKVFAVVLSTVVTVYWLIALLSDERWPSALPSGFTLLLSFALPLLWGSAINDLTNMLFRIQGRWIEGQVPRDVEFHDGAAIITRRNGETVFVRLPEDFDSDNLNPATAAWLFNEVMKDV